MIKVLQERRVKKINYDSLIAHLIDLRAAALRHPGYLTGETLSKGDDPVDVLTISTWVSEANWKAWVTSEERIEFEEIINNLLDGEAKVSIYKMPAEED